MTIEQIITADKFNPLDGWLRMMLAKLTAKKLRSFLQEKTGKTYSTAEKGTCVSAAYEVIRAER